MGEGHGAKLAAKSSVNGLAHCGRAATNESRTRTWFWLTVTLAFACVTTYELAMIAADYRSFPVLTVVDVSTKKEGAVFPTVIVCSHNPVPCRNLFPLSLRYPKLWAASGCSAGMQIRGYVADVVAEFDRASRGRQGQGVPQAFALQHHDGSADHPLVALWAHHNVESPLVKRILAEDDLLPLLRQLRTFMESAWLSSDKVTGSSSPDALRIQHHFAVSHLKGAEMIASFVKDVVPALNNFTMKAFIGSNAGKKPSPVSDDGRGQNSVGDVDGRIEAVVSVSKNRSRVGVRYNSHQERDEAWQLATNEVATALANHFLEDHSWENVSKQLKADWIDAVAHGSEFQESATIAGSKLCAGLAQYYAEKIHVPLARYPSLWSLINRPPLVADALNRISENLRRILNSKSFARGRFMAPRSVNGSSSHPQTSAVKRFIDGNAALSIGRQMDQMSFSKSARGVQDRHSRFRSLFLKLPTEVQDDLMIDEHELIMECNYMGTLCDAIGLTSFTSTVYGKCVSFNDHELMEKVKHSGPLKTNSLGQDGGLSLQLRIAEDHDYTRDSVRTSGARVTVLPFNGAPNVLEDGFDVPISFETNLELSARRLKRLPRPYPSDCQTHWNETDYSFKDHLYDYKSCLRFCLGHEIYNTCKCVDPRSKAHQVEYKGRHFEGPWCDYSSPGGRNR